MVLVCGLLWLGGNSWYCLCGNMLGLGSLEKWSWVCRQLGQKLNCQGTLMGAEWALPWIISCRLLQLNPRVQGEHLTSHLSWEAA